MIYVFINTGQGNALPNPAPCGIHLYIVLVLEQVTKFKNSLWLRIYYLGVILCKSLIFLNQSLFCHPQVSSKPFSSIIYLM